MLKDVVAAKPLEGHDLYLQFEDGVTGVVNVAALVTFQGIFAALQDISYFGRVRVDQDLGTVMWPNGADLDPDVLYSVVSGIPLPEFAIPHMHDEGGAN
jgi:hypothetical protein